MMATQATRPNPTLKLIVELAGANNDLLGCVHHGLAEVPLNQVYPHLDLDEALAFAASSWRTRDRDIGRFSPFVQAADLYGIFRDVYAIGMPWLNKHKRISGDMKARYDRLNPFQGEDLAARLEMIDEQASASLRHDLQSPVMNWVFECHYHDAKKKQGGDNHNIQVMGFQNFYPATEKIGPAYAAEIGRILARYPGEIILPGQTRTPMPARPYQAPAQLRFI